MTSSVCICPISLPLIGINFDPNRSLIKEGLLIVLCVITSAHSIMAPCVVDIIIFYDIFKLNVNTNYKCIHNSFSGPFIATRCFGKKNNNDHRF